MLAPLGVLWAMDLRPGRSPLPGQLVGVVNPEIGAGPGPRVALAGKPEMDLDAVPTTPQAAYVSPEDGEEAAAEAGATNE